MSSKETCTATKIMHPMRWTVDCQKPKGHKGKHQRWSESGTKGWVTEWTDDDHGASP